MLNRQVLTSSGSWRTERKGFVVSLMAVGVVLTMAGVTLLAMSTEAISGAATSNTTTTTAPPPPPLPSSLPSPPPLSTPPSSTTTSTTSTSTTTTSTTTTSTTMPSATTTSSTSTPSSTTSAPGGATSTTLPSASTTTPASTAGNSSTSAPVTASSGSLAFTGFGSGFSWMLFVGAVLALVGGALFTLIDAPRRLLVMVSNRSQRSRGRLDVPSGNSIGQSRLWVRSNLITVNPQGMPKRLARWFLGRSDRI